MINKKEMEEMRKEIAIFDSKRETIIKNSRDVLRLSKKIIYSVHRKEMEDAENNIKKINKELSILAKAVKKDPKLNIGAYKEAVQEYVEAVCYYSFAKDKKIQTRKELDVDSELYLQGLCDLSGELVRKAVNAGIKGSSKEVVEIKKFVDDLYDEMMQFDLRNSELRKKFDSVKWNLKKLDDLVFNLKLLKK